MGHVIWIEGIIGAGKSTLTKEIAEAMNLRPLFEPVESNFLLEDFYREPKKYAFAMQMHLLNVRFNLQTLAAAEAIGCVGYDGAILDRGLPGDRVFAKLHIKYGNIEPKLWQVYEMAFDIMSCSLRPPSLLVYLDVSPETAHDRVIHRDRTAEAGLSMEYLKDLKAGYEDLIAEVESGEHAWSMGMSVLRIPWDVPYQPTERVIEMIKAAL